MNRLYNVHEEVRQAEDLRDKVRTGSVRPSVRLSLGRSTVLYVSHLVLFCDMALGVKRDTRGGRVILQMARN